MDNSTFKKRRIDYQNNWPNSVEFEREKEYSCKVKDLEKSDGSIFKTVALKELNDKDYNIVISFLIEALDELRQKPGHSFLFTFMALDHVSKLIYLNENLTIRLNLISEDILYHQDEFNSLNKIIPLKSCKYMSKRLESSDRVRNRVKNIDELKDLLIAVDNKYLKEDYFNDKDIANINRKKAFLYQKIISDNLKEETFQVNFLERIKLVLNGYLYSFRNDISHGSVIADTKSSKTRFSTYAGDYWAFMYTYYIVISLIEKKWSFNFYDYKRSVQINIKKYKSLFGKSIRD